MTSEKNKLYVGNLSFDVNEQELNTFLSEKGLAVQSLNIIKDKYTNRSKGFGFIEVASEQDMTRAIEILNGHQLKGRTIKVSQARSREERNRRSHRDKGKSRNSRWDY